NDALMRWEADRFHPFYTALNILVGGALIWAVMSILRRYARFPDDSEHTFSLRDLFVMTTYIAFLVAIYMADVRRQEPGPPKLAEMIVYTGVACFAWKVCLMALPYLRRLKKFIQDDRKKSG